MKVISIAAAGVSVVLIALTLAPAAAEYRAYAAIGSLICSAVALGAILSGWREPASRTPAAPQSGSLSAAPPRPAPPAPTVDASPKTTSSGDADVIGFLAALQDKGRLVDFLADDISGYSDAQVGAAARVVHQGCKVILDEYVRIVPVRAETEGAQVTVPAGYAPDEYRLVGKISGQAPFAGTLVHRGWKAQSVNLPRILRPDDRRLPTIAPAEVELR